MRIVGIIVAFIFLPMVSAEDKTELLSAAWQASKAENYGNAIQLASKLILLDASHADAFYLRGRAHFQNGDVQKSFPDFEKYVSLHPQGKSRLWERGITCYYVKKFEEGVKQFELYQTYHSEDVENAVWQILCKSKLIGFEKASKTPLRIREDKRVPMAQIYKLYCAKTTPDEVLSVAKMATNAQARNTQLFYAHLYIGLFYDINNDLKLAKTHMKQAVDHKIGHYMWDVANVHWKMLNQPKSKAK